MHHLPLRILHLLAVFCTLILAACSPCVLSAQEPDIAGHKIYQKVCLDCHGEMGKGVESVYPQPLIGDLSVKELTAYIEQTMPEGEPEKCVGAEAAQVAQYIHEAFYSITAQARNAPVRVELSRLTVPQYQNRVTDLVGSFSWRRTLGENRGLRAEYFKSRRRNRENRVLERVDSIVAFDFGEKPEFLAKLIAEQQKKQEESAKSEEKQNEKAEKPTPVQEEYAVTWSGSIYAPETGDYEVTFRTTNSGQVWLNDPRTPLIDARVKSGDQTDYSKTVKLQAGRLYYVRVEYFKNKTEPSGMIQLRWKRPHHTAEPIATRFLYPENAPWSLVVETPFPPDDKSVGYERGTSVSPEWDEATTFAAIEVADKILEHIQTLAKLPKEKEQHGPKLREFCELFVERAFIRPLTPAEKTLYIDRQFEEAEDDYLAVKRVVLLTLKSPRFLFPGAASPEFDQFRTAEWLALTLWDSLPDDKLITAAREGKLSERSEIEFQAERMMRDDRARAKLSDFFQQWLNLDHYHDLSKSESLYPEYTPELLSDLRSSLEIMIDRAVWSGTSDYRQLLLTTEYPLNPQLAQFYGQASPAGQGFSSVSFSKEQRAGILTHPFMLTGLAYDDASSPIHRGVFLSRSLLGRFLKPPPIAVAPLPVDLHPDMTTRERVTMQTNDATCMSCHGMINNLGFSLENFDAVGRYRDQEQGKSIDAQGKYIARDGSETMLNGARGLAEFLVNSPEAHEAFVEQMFQYLTKQPIQAFGRETAQNLRSEFRNRGFHIRQLMANIAVESVQSALRISEGLSAAVQP